MGFLFSQLWKEDTEVLMVGLDAAGKDCILYYLKEKNSINTPIINNFFFTGIYEINFIYKGLSIIKVNLGAGDMYFIKRKIKEYFGKAKEIILVIDSQDISRLEEDFIDEFNFLISKAELINQPILVFANKQDLDRVLSIEGIIKKIEIEKMKDRDWIAFGTSAKTGEGIEEGFDWLISVLKKWYRKLFVEEVI